MKKIIIGIIMILLILNIVNGLRISPTIKVTETENKFIYNVNFR